MERQVLVELANDGNRPRWLDEDDDIGMEIRDRLAADGRVFRQEFIDDDGNECVSWKISLLGKLALSVCTAMS